MFDFSDLNAAGVDTFGQLVTYRPNTAVDFELRAVIGAPRQLEELSPGTATFIRARLADFADQPPENGDIVSIGESDYYVVQFAVDVSGIVGIALNRK